MRKTVFVAVLFLLGLTGPVHGQSSFSGLHIYVSDSVSRVPLPGAHLTIISGRDTSTMATNERGEAVYRTVFRSDSVEIRVRHMGYEAKQLVVRAPADGHTHGVFVELAESAQEIAEIVVVGEVVAVVMKGDTVQFNADAFKTFVNDPMSKLFEILPGMKFEGGRLTYLDEPIHRITVDGQRLFSNHVELALENIRADDVVDVRVYKTEDDSNALHETENRSPITVADVRTRSKPTMIHHITLAAGGGSGLDPEHRDGQRQGLYDASGTLVSSRVGQSLSTEAGGSNIGGNPTNFGSIKGNLRYTREEIDKFKLSTRNHATIGKYTGESWADHTYFPTDTFDSRRYNEQRLSVSRDRRYTSSNEFDYTLPDKSILAARASFSYADRENNIRNTILAMQDMNVLQSQQLSHRDRQNPYQVSAETIFSKKIGKARINTSLNMRHSNSDVSGWRIDTLSSSTSHIYLDNRSTEWDRTYGGRISAGSNLSPTLSLHLSNQLSYVNSQSHRTSVDMLTGTVDPINSYDYRIHEVNNTVRTELGYRDNAKQRGVTQAQIGLTWEYKDMQRDEWFPKGYVLQRNFNLLRGSASMEYKFGGFNALNFHYGRGSSAPSLLDYRELDDSNPLMLRAGNPNLKQTTGNLLSGSGTFVKGPSTYEFQVRFGTEENLIVNKSRYFPEEIYLPQFDYRALAGSTLISRENRDGRRIFDVGGNHSVRSGRLNMNIRSELRYGYRRYPAYIYEQPVLNHTHLYIVGIKLIGNFSSYFIPSLEAYTNYNDRRSGEVRHRWLEQKLGLYLRAMFFRSVELNSTNDLLWNVQRPDIPGMERFGVVSNLSLDYLFDDQGDFRLKVQLNDVLNRRQRVRISVEDEYISQTYGHFLGRHFFVRIVYRI